MVSALAVVLGVLAAAPDFDAIVGGVSDRSHADSCAAMKAWAAQNPADARGRRGLVWCARLLRSDGALDDARAIVERITGDDEPAMQALQTLGEIHFAQGRFAQAATDYRPLAASSIELWRYTGEVALAEIERTRRVWWQAVVGVLILLLWLPWRAAPVRRLLWPPPAELVVLAPLLLLLGAIALTQPVEVARGLAALVAGGAALAWLNGAYWRARPPKQRVLEAIKGLGQAMLLLDAVLVSSGLWRPLWQSLTGGFD